MSQLYLSYKQLLHVITFSGRQLCSLGLFDTYTFCPENYRCFMVFLCVSWLSWGCLVPSDLVYCILAPLIYGTSNQYWDDTTQCMVRIWIHFIHQNPTCSCNTITKHMASSHVWIFHKSAHIKNNSLCLSNTRRRKNLSLGWVPTTKNRLISSQCPGK